MKMNRDRWVFLIVTAALSAAAGLAAPVAAEMLRAWKKEGVRSAKKTKSKTDDKVWNIVGPGVDRLAELLDKRDFKAIREEIDRLENESPNPNPGGPASEIRPEKESEKSDDKKPK